MGTEELQSPCYEQRRFDNIMKDPEWPRAVLAVVVNS